MIKLLVVLITALVAFFTYWLGDKRKLNQIKTDITYWEGEYAKALHERDTVAMSIASKRLNFLRTQAGSFKGK